MKAKRKSSRAPRRSVWYVIQWATPSGWWADMRVCDTALEAVKALAIMRHEDFDTYRLIKRTEEEIPPNPEVRHAGTKGTE